MKLSVAMRLAAGRSCDMSWDEKLCLWTARAISHDGDPVCLSETDLMAMSPADVLAHAIPERP